MKQTGSHALAALVLLFPLVAGAAPPANDSCDKALGISPAVPVTTTVDTKEATTQTSDPLPSCLPPGTPTAKSVWFTFTPSATDVYSLTTTGTTPENEYLPVLQIFTGTCGSLVPLQYSCGESLPQVILNAGTTYTILATGKPITVDPEIRFLVNGSDVCGTGPGPGPGGGGTSGCPDPLDVKAGDAVVAYVLNKATGLKISTVLGSLSWSFGTNASPAVGTGQDVPFSYTAPIENTNVVFSFTADGMNSITRTARVRVSPKTGSLVMRSLPPAEPLAPTDTLTVPSPGGILNLNISKAQVAYAYRYQLPSAIYLPGRFISDLFLTNWAVTEAKVMLKLSTDNGDFVAGPYGVPPSGTHVFEGFIKTLFNMDTFGTLLIESSQPVTAGARTYSPACKGTNGQFSKALNISTQLLRYDEYGMLIGLRQDSAFRTNIGLFGKGTGPCNVEMTLRGEDGVLSGGGPKTVTLQPDRYWQQSIGQFFGVTDARGLSILIHNPTNGCDVGGIAYVVDNESEDPYAVQMSK